MVEPAENAGDIMHSYELLNAIDRGLMACLKEPRGFHAAQLDERSFTPSSQIGAR